MKKVIFLAIWVIVLGACRTKTPQCYLISDSMPITHKEVKATKKVNTGSEFLFAFNPLLLPVKIIYSSASGFSVVNTGGEEVVTPIGSVGIQYSFGTKSTKEINGHKITEGDYLVGIADRKKDKIELYKIEGYSRLKVITIGKTIIDAQSGYVEIDVTDSKIEELTFIDNSRFSIVNTTDKVQTFSLVTKDFSGAENEIECEIQPSSYRYFPRMSASKSMGEFLGGSYSFEIKKNDINNNSLTVTSKKVTWGEVFRIQYNDTKSDLILNKQ